MIEHRPIRALIVGCGRAAGGGPEPTGVCVSSHAAAYKRHKDFRTVACVDPDQARRKAFMQRWSVPHGFASIEEAIADGIEFDVASVCSPTACHAADLRVLLETPVRAVWCEKPLTTAAAVSKPLVDAYRKAGKPLAVNYLRRWSPAMGQLKSDVAAGKWGAVRSIVGFYTKGVRNNGSHLVDLLHFLIGPVTIRAVAMARTDFEPADPTVDAILCTDAGVPVHLVGGDARDFALFELEIIAEYGAIRIERSGRSILTRRRMQDPDEADHQVLDYGERLEVSTNDLFLRALDNIYHTLVDVAPLASDGTTALAAELICDELIERSREPKKHTT